MRKLRALMGVALVLSAVSCSSPTETQQPAVAPGPVDPAAAQQPRLDIGIGDVDVAVKVVGQLHPKSSGDNVKVNEIYTQRDDLVRTDIEISHPYPEDLWFTFTAGSQKNFPGHAIVVKLRVYVDDLEVEQFSFVFGAKAQEEYQQRDVDVLKGLDVIPKTMLVHAEAEVIFLKNTDEFSVDPEDTTGTAENSTTVLGNPIRINFIK